jgi:hypothetical protein
VCPKCGFGIMIDISKKFVCICGYVLLDANSILLQESMVLRTKRISLCEKCSNYNDNRCVLIEWGCKPAFINFVLNPNSVCPINIWEAEK